MRPPESRYTMLCSLVHRATADLLAAAVLLHVAHEARDHESLGYETWSAYLDAIGVARSADSKMRRAAAFFGGAWLQLPEVDQRELTLERVYLAARLAEQENLSIEDGLAEAVANPSHALVARIKGEDGSEEIHTCSCGHVHRRAS